MFSRKEFILQDHDVIEKDLQFFFPRKLCLFEQALREIFLIK